MPASLANFPLGQWTADARRFYARGDIAVEEARRRAEEEANAERKARRFPFPFRS